MKLSSCRAVIDTSTQVTGINTEEKKHLSYHNILGPCVKLDLAMTRLAKAELNALERLKERLLSRSGTNGRKHRRRPRRKIVRPKKTSEEKACNALRKHQHKIEYTKELRLSRSKIDEEAERLHEMFPGKTVAHHRKVILQASTGKLKKRKAPTLWNAYVSQRTDEKNEGKVSKVNQLLLLT